VVLSIAGILDALYREVDTELWLAALPFGFSLGFLSLQDYPYSVYLPYIFTIPIIIILIILYYLGFLGGADVWLSIFLAFSMPVVDRSLLPGLYLSFLYSSPFFLAYYLWKLYSKCGISCIRALGVKVKGRDIVEELRWWIPKGARIIGDPHEIVTFEELWDKEVFASPLLPVVAITVFGAVLAVILGDYPIRLLLEV